jgi:hypothetical protein
MTRKTVGAAYALDAGLQIRRVFRDAVCVGLLAGAFVIAMSALSERLPQPLLRLAATVLLSLSVLRTWGRDVQSGSLVQLALGPFQFVKLFASRLALMLLISVTAVTPSLRQSAERAPSRWILTAVAITTITALVAATLRSHIRAFVVSMCLFGAASAACSLHQSSRRNSITLLMLVIIVLAAMATQLKARALAALPRAL